MLKIRVANQKDLVRIVEIHNQAIPTQRSTGYISLLTVADIQDWFDKHRPDYYPIYLAEIDGKVVGWNSLSAYRAKRAAFRFCAETSYYIDKDYHRQGIASRLLEHVMTECEKLEIKTLVAYVLEKNIPSIKLMEKYSFERWAFFPRIADFDGKEVGQLIYGKRIYE